MKINQVSNQSKNINLYLIALFITNIGNSASFIICGKYSYDYFGVASIFGALLMLESIQAILLSGFSGILIDKSGAKRVGVICDIALFIVVFIGALTSETSFKSWNIVIVYFLINLIKPIQSTALFALTKKISNDEYQYQLNSKIGMHVQLGYLIGLGITGVSLKYLSIKKIMLLDSLTYLISGVLIFFILVDETKSIINTKLLRSFNFKEIVGDYKVLFKKNNRVLLICLVLGIQVNLIVAYNTNLFKYVATIMGNNSAGLSILEGTYTIVCILTSYLISNKRIIKLDSTLIFLFFVLEALVFLIFPFVNKIIFVIPLVFLFAVVSSVVFPSLFSLLYSDIDKSEAGKVGGVKTMFQSVIALPILMLNAYLIDFYNISISYAYLASICLIGSVVMYFIFNNGVKINRFNNV